MCTRRRISFLYILSMAKLVVQNTTTQSEVDRLFNLNTTALTRLMLGVIAANTPLTLASNAVMFCLHTLDAGAHPHVASENAPRIILTEAYTACVVCVLCFVLDRRTLAEARAAVNAKMAVASESTVRELLLALCDAEVCLGADLRMSGPSASLAALLLDRGGNLDGRSFFDLVHAADRERFVAFLARKVEDCLAHSLHLHLIDSGGMLVSVQLFHSGFEDFKGATWHLLGICESAVEGQNHFPEHTLHTPCSAFVPLCSSEGATDSIEVWVNPVNLDIIKCSLGFATIMGGPVARGVNLVDKIVDGWNLARRIQHHFQENMYSEGGSAIIELGEVTFHQAKTRGKSAFMATCVFDYTPKHETEGHDTVQAQDLTLSERIEGRTVQLIFRLERRRSQIPTTTNVSDCSGSAILCTL